MRFWAKRVPLAVKNAKRPKSRLFNSFKQRTKYALNLVLEEYLKSPYLDLLKYILYKQIFSTLRPLKLISL